MFRVIQFRLVLFILAVILHNCVWCNSASTSSYVKSTVLYPTGGVASNEVTSDSRQWSIGVPYQLFKKMVTTIMNQSRYVPSKTYDVVPYHSDNELMEKDSGASSFGSTIEMFQKIRDFFVAAKNSILEDFTFRESGESRKIKGLKVKKKFKKFLLPLLLAYKLKFLTLVPVFIGSLVLLVGSTGLAGFFFALFAAVMSLKNDSKY